MNGLPTVAVAADGLVTAGAGTGVGAGLTVDATSCVPDPLPFVAVTVNRELPAAVGVPEIRPVAALTRRPAGSRDALNRVGVFVAVIW